MSSNSEERYLIEEALQSFKLDRDNPNRQRDLQELAEIALGQHKFQLAGEFAAIGLRVPRPLPGIKAVFDLAMQLDTAVTALDNQDYDNFLTALKKAYANGHEGAEMAVTHLVTTKAKKAAGSDNRAFLNALAEFAARVGHDDIAATLHQRVEDLEGGLHKTVDELLGRAQALMSRNTLHHPSDTVEAVANWTMTQFLAYLSDSQTHGKEVLKLTDAALHLAEFVEYREEAARQLHERASQEVAEIKQKIEKIGNRGEAQYQTIQDRKREIDELSQRWRTGGSVADSVIVKQIDRGLRELVSQCYDNLAQTGVNDERHQEIEEIRNWAISELSQISGRRGWQSLQLEAAQRLRYLEKQFNAAQADFEDGRPDEAQVNLQILLSDYATDDEWHDLQSRVKQAQDWLSWQRHEAYGLSQGEYQSDLLGEIREYASFQLPPVYWQQSTVPEYLRQAHNTIRQEAKYYFRSNDFIQYLKNWLELEMTSRLVTNQVSAASINDGDLPRSVDLAEMAPQFEATAPLPDDTPLNAEQQLTSSDVWNADRFLRKVNAARMEDSIANVERVIQNAPTPPNLAAALAEITPEAWDYIKEHMRRPEPLKPHQPVQQWDLWVVGCVAGVVVVALVFFGILLLWSDNFTLFGVKPTETPTPTSVPTLPAMETLPPLATNTPTLTPPPSPTDMPPPTNTPSPTPSPTPTDVPFDFSFFYQADQSLVIPAMPLAAESVWLINPDNALAEPPLNEDMWVQDQISDSGTLFYYMESVTDTLPISVTWILDNGLNAGLYQLYVLDTMAFTVGEQAFTITLDDEPAIPFRGQNTIIFNDKSTGQQTTDWLPLGAYAVAQGQTLAVRTEAAPQSVPFAVTPLLIAKVSGDQQAMIETLPQERTLVSLLDDERAEFRTRVGEDYTLSTLFQEVFTNTLSWNGNYIGRVFDPGTEWEVRIDWAAAGRLPPGDYELYVWIPREHATILADYTLLVDGEPLEPVHEMRQSEWAGRTELDEHWVSMGIWTVTEETAVGVRLSVSNQKQIEPGEIGIDAVALVRVGN